MLHFPESKSVAGAVVQAESADRFFDLGNMRQNRWREGDGGTNWRLPRVRISAFRRAGAEFRSFNSQLLPVVSPLRPPAGLPRDGCRLPERSGRNEVNGASGLLSRVRWPRGGEWKARALGVLYRHCCTLAIRESRVPFSRRRADSSRPPMDVSHLPIRGRRRY
jgi:hypothetical protein